MEYVGIATQQARNNRKSIMLLASFPLLVFALLYLGCFLFASYHYNTPSGEVELFKIFLLIFPRLLVITIMLFIIGCFANVHLTTFLVILAFSYIGCFGMAFIKSNDKIYPLTNNLFFNLLPYVAIGVLIWFIVAFYTNVYIIDKATDAYTLERRGENKRVYNLVENLCISCGMEMPQIHVIETPVLNAFASGVSSKSYTITLTRGIIDTLNDKELEGVIAHELTHIRNNDVRVLIVAIVFVGFFDVLTEYSMRALSSFPGGRSSNDREKNNEGGGAIFFILVLLLVLAVVGYGASILMRFAISRNREYMADAGAAELTREPRELASALRKVSKNSALPGMQNKSLAQLFIENKSEKRLFTTHPPIERRIAVLEQF